MAQAYLFLNSDFFQKVTATLEAEFLKWGKFF
jgi:hypothetical protein